MKLTPDDVESLTSRGSFGSEKLSDKSHVKEIENLRSSSSTRSSEKIIPETSAKKTSHDGRVQSTHPSQVKPESKLETFNQKSENQTDSKLFKPKNPESGLSSKFSSAAQEKTFFSQKNESTVKAVQEPVIKTRVPFETSTSGVNFINILLEPFSSALRSF